MVIPWSPIGSGEEDLVARPRAPGGERHARQGMPDARGGDVQPVHLAVLDDLGVAADDRHARLARGTGHGAHFGRQRLGGETGLQHERGDERHGPGAADREVVHGAVHRQLADGPAGEHQRCHHEAVGGDGDGRAAHGHARRVAQPVSFAGPLGSEEQRREQTVHEPARRLPAGAVRHLDLRVAEADHRGVGAGGLPRRSRRGQDPERGRGLPMLVVVVCCA